MSPKLRVLAPVAGPEEAAALLGVLSGVLAGGFEVVVLGVIPVPAASPLDAPELADEARELETTLGAAAARSPVLPGRVTARVVLARDPAGAVMESLEGFDLLAVSTGFLRSARGVFGGIRVEDAAEAGIPVLVWAAPGR